MSLKNSKGQGIVESLVTLPVLMTLIASLSYLTYFTLVYQVASYHLHEALMCSQSLPVQVCQMQRLDSLQRVLIFKEIISFRLTKKNESIVGTVRIALHPAIHIQMQMGQEF